MQAIIKLCKQGTSTLLIFTIFSYSCSLSSGERTGTFSYLGLARAAWGNKVAVLIQFLIMIYTSGICIAFSVLLGEKWFLNLNKELYI